jgi:hypothetical protein
MEGNGGLFFTQKSWLTSVSVTLVDSLWCVVMESTLFTRPWLGETRVLEVLWNSFGPWTLMSDFFFHILNVNWRKKLTLVTPPLDMLSENRRRESSSSKPSRKRMSGSECRLRPKVFLVGLYWASNRVGFFASMTGRRVSVFDVWMWLPRMWVREKNTTSGN